MAGMRQTDRQTDRRAGPGHRCVLSVSGLSEHDAELVLSVHACLHVLKPCPSHACARHREAQRGRRSRLYQLIKAFNSRAFSVNASSSRLILNYYYYVFQNKNKHYVLAVFSTSLTIYKSFASRFLSQPITVWRRSRVVQPPVLCVLCLLRSWNIVFTTAGQPDCGRAPHSLLVVTVQLSKVTERIGWR